MNPNELSAEQIKDIDERTAKAKVALDELQLEPQAHVQSVNMGDDVFAQKVVIYMHDQKYLSPIKKSDL